MFDQFPFRDSIGGFVASSFAATLYRPLIFGLAVLLVGVTAARLPVSGYVASTTARRMVTVEAGRSPAALSTQSGKSSDALTSQAVARMLMQAPVLSRIGASIGLPVADRQQVASRLSLETNCGSNGGEVWLTIRGRGASPEQAQALAAAAAREAIAAIDDRQDRQTHRQDERLSRWELRELRHYEQRARFALEEFLTTWEPDAPSANEETVAQVAATAFETVAGTSQPEGEPLTKPIENGANAPAVDGESHWRDTLAELTQNYEQAVAEREEAERRCDEKLRQYVAANRVVRSWQVTPATVVARIGGGVSRSRTLGLLLLAVIAGGLIGWLGGFRGLPGARRVSAISAAPQAARLLTTVAEGVVLLYAAALLVLLASGDPLLRDLLADPFGTTADVVPRLLERWRS